MFATVYRVRDRGVRLPRPRAGVSGRLCVSHWRDGFEKPSLRAELLDHNGRAWTQIPELYWARIERITEHGIVITGREVVARRSTRKSSTDHWTQTWWCLVHTLYLADRMDVTDLDEVDVLRQDIEAEALAKITGAK